MNMFLSRLKFLLLLLPMAACQAQEEKYVEGVHYQVLPQVVRTANADKIEVNELFSYHCGHCYNFQSQVREWHKSLPSDVDFQRTHVVWNSSLELYARAYYSALSLDVFEQLHIAVFEAIHLKKQALLNEEDIRELFIDEGVDSERFTRTFNSFGITSMMNQGKARARAYRSKGTPELVINGKYRVTMRMSGGGEGMLDVASFLITKERRQIGKPNA
ncbi:MAG: thiol:disulfide interchange protein DsbA/DsbL [Porticoccaceae bacterium]|nr:thiol:disulfide interchange protein DsbA/DsbL [Porticoccaceae bacterium]